MNIIVIRNKISNKTNNYLKIRLNYSKQEEHQQKLFLLFIRRTLLSLNDLQKLWKEIP